MQLIEGISLSGRRPCVRWPAAEHRLKKADGFIGNQLTKPDIFCLWHFDCYSSFPQFCDASTLSLEIAFLNRIYIF